MLSRQGAVSRNAGGTLFSHTNGQSSSGTKNACQQAEGGGAKHRPRGQGRGGPGGRVGRAGPGAGRRSRRPLARGAPACWGSRGRWSSSTPRSDRQCCALAARRPSSAAASASSLHATPPAAAAAVSWERRQSAGRRPAQSATSPRDATRPARWHSGRFRAAQAEGSARARLPATSRRKTRWWARRQGGARWEATWWVPWSARGGPWGASFGKFAGFR